MTIKRQLLNINQKSIDVRMGAGALDELPRMVAAAVGKPKRALVVAASAEHEAYGEVVRRSLIDAGFAVEEYVLAADAQPATFACLQQVLERCAAAELTADDEVVAVGDAAVCSVVAAAAQLWCGGTACILVPTTLDGMVTLATEMEPLALADGADLVTLAPRPSMVVCDFNLVSTMDEDTRRLGRVLMLGAAFAEGKRVWSSLEELAPRLAADDVVALAEIMAPVQQARRNVIKAANPSARHALAFGCATAQALAACLGDAAPAWALRAEGMRFEARLAVEAAGLDPEVVFDQDDLFEDLGVSEYGFALDAHELVAAIKREHARRSNRFLLPLPKNVGTIRLTAVPDDVLLRHAQAYVASRAELVA